MRFSNASGASGEYLDARNSRKLGGDDVEAVSSAYSLSACSRVTSQDEPIAQNHVASVRKVQTLCAEVRLRIGVLQKLREALDIPLDEVGMQRRVLSTLSRSARHARLHASTGELTVSRS